MAFQRFLGALAPVALLLASCGGDIGAADNGGGSGSSNGNLRFVNASQVSLLDLYEGSTAIRKVVALFETTGYANLSTGTHTLAVRESGTTAALATAPVSSARDDHQTLVAYTTGVAPATAMATTVLADNELAPLANNAKLRVFNTAGAAIETGPVDVFVVTTTCAANGALTTPAVATGVSGLQAQYVAITSSTTAAHVCVTAAGVRTNVLLELPAVTFSNQRIVTLVLARTALGPLKSVVLDQP